MPACDDPTLGAIAVTVDSGAVGQQVIPTVDDVRRGTAADLDNAANEVGAELLDDDAAPGRRRPPAQAHPGQRPTSAGRA